MKDFTIELRAGGASKRDNELDLAWVKVNLPHKIGNPATVELYDLGLGHFKAVAVWANDPGPPYFWRCTVYVGHPPGSVSVDLLKLIIEAFKKKFPVRALSR